MADTLFLANPRAKWVDENGFLTAVAIRALEQLFQRTGGSQGTNSNTAPPQTTDALPTLSAVTNSQTSDSPAALIPMFPDVPDDVTVLIRALEARLIAAESLIAELREGSIT